jgi:hypothetical protein
VRRLAGIQGGVECERFAPLLAALADGAERLYADRTGRRLRISHLMRRGPITT